MQIRMLRLSKEKYFVIQEVSFDFAMPYCTKMKKVVINMPSAIINISAL